MQLEQPYIYSNDSLSEKELRNFNKTTILLQLIFICVLFDLRSVQGKLFAPGGFPFAALLVAGEQIAYMKYSTQCMEVYLFWQRLHSRVFVQRIVLGWRWIE